MKAYCRSKIIINNLIIANTFKTRLVGLMGKNNLHDEGLLLINCKSIHCFFMKIVIDVLYLSDEMIVLDKETIKPWNIGKIVKKAKHVMELPEGAAKDINIGEIVEIVE
ncbi:MAG: DUF192 domain-containing protein [Sedimentibacter saalensis]|uniref:DUF192 domain-containing protein n=1 Tax=Sedimentibacter saalensis TaxID=130788 RepID=UPI0031589F6A